MAGFYVKKMSSEDFISLLSLLSVETTAKSVNPAMPYFLPFSKKPYTSID